MKSQLSTNHLNQTQQPIITNPTIALRASLRPGPTLSDWLHLAMLLNSFADSSAGHDLPFDEVYDAIDHRQFHLILQAYAGRCSDFSFMQSPDGTLDEMNQTLRAAANEFRDRHFQKGGVASNGFCLALAIVLYAIRQKLDNLSQFIVTRSFDNN